MATGGIALNGSSQYLEFNTRVVSAFPFTLVCWVAQNASGSSQFVIAQQQSNGDRYAGFYIGSNGTDKHASLQNPGNGDNGTKSTSPHPNSTLQLAVAVFTSTTSRTMYFGNNTGGTSTTSMTDDISNHDRITIGAWHYNSGAAGLYLNGAVAEAHIFNTALSSSDVTTLLTTKPEEVSGWVDGWILSSNSDLTSIGGTRTLTAVGSPTTASLTLPYTRTAAPVITGPTGAAGASSITTSAAENQNAAGTWTATNSVSWSLSGTDAADLSIAGGVVTKASGNFDYEAKPSYSFAVDNGSATQAVTLNITNASEPPLAPTIGTATAGNASASVAFTPPNNTGRPAITGYTATSSPGGLTGTGASSPITVSGLTNGTAYTFTVTADNVDGTGPASAASNSVTPSAGLAYGFKFSTVAGLQFGSIVGALTGIGLRPPGEQWVATAHASANHSTIVAQSGTLTMGSGGRLPDWTHGSFTDATSYFVSFRRVSDGATCSALLTSELVP